MKKKLLGLSLVTVLLIGITGCTKMQSTLKNFESETTGLNRTATVYSETGEVIAQYKGKNMMVKDGDGGTITINFDGKRIIFCNASVIIEELESNK